jgi:hypothetical protein
MGRILILGGIDVGDALGPDHNCLSPLPAQAELIHLQPYPNVIPNSPAISTLQDQCFVSQPDPGIWSDKDGVVEITIVYALCLPNHFTSGDG